MVNLRDMYIAAMYMIVKLADVFLVSFTLTNIRIEQ